MKSFRNFLFLLIIYLLVAFLLSIGGIFANPRDLLTIFGILGIIILITLYIKSKKEIINIESYKVRFEKLLEHLKYEGIYLPNEILDKPFPNISNVEIRLDKIQQDGSIIEGIFNIKIPDDIIVEDLVFLKKYILENKEKYHIMENFNLISAKRIYDSDKIKQSREN